jgi:hypothetical protein
VTAPDPYAYPDQPYYAPGWQEPPARREPLAVAALVTGVLGTGPVAVVLGAVGLHRVRSRGLRGRGLALAGLLLGVLGTLAWLAVGAVAVATAVATRPLGGDVAAPRDAHAVQLVTGVCLETLPTGPEVDRVRVVPCAQDHRAQVLTSYAFGADEEWPGDAAVVARVSAACTLTEDERASDLRLVAWSPTERSWAGGDRTGLCLAVSDEARTGSLLG